MSNRPKTFWAILNISIDLPFSAGNKSFLTKKLHWSWPVEELPGENKQTTFWQIINEPVGPGLLKHYTRQNDKPSIWGFLNRTVGKNFTIDRYYTGPILGDCGFDIWYFLTKHRKL